MKKLLIKMFYCFIKLFVPIKKQLFVSIDYYSDSPRFIFEKMHQMFPDYSLVCVLSPDGYKDEFGIIPPFVKKIRHSWMKFYYYLASSFCVINIFEFKWYYFKRKGQFFIQTYHGDRGPKKVLLELNNDYDVCDGEVTDLFVSGSEFGSNRAPSAFKYSGRIIQEGMPRNDQLVVIDSEKANLIKQKLNIPTDKRVLLYCPTFRDDAHLNFNQYLDLNILRQSIDGNPIILFRKHRVDRVSTPRQFDDSGIVDVSNYPDMSDLLLIADILISDYSTAVYDFALTSRPIVLYLFDYASYASTRNLKFRLESTGLKIVASQKELIDYLSQGEFGDSKNIDAQCLAFFKTNESGFSSEKICSIIDSEFKKHIL